MMNANEIRNTARQMTIEALIEALEASDAVKFADGSFAILQTIDTGDAEPMEVWTEVTVKSKAWKDTKVAKAFDPYIAAEEWEAEKKFKADEKAAKAAAKKKKA